jgi:hypothetical protein
MKLRASTEFVFVSFKKRAISHCPHTRKGHASLQLVRYKHEERSPGPRAFSGLHTRLGSMCRPLADTDVRYSDSGNTNGAASDSSK